MLRLHLKWKPYAWHMYPLSKLFKFNQLQIYHNLGILIIILIIFGFALKNNFGVLTDQQTNKKFRHATRVIICTRIQTNKTRKTKLIMKIIVMTLLLISLATAAGPTYGSDCSQPPIKNVVTQIMPSLHSSRSPRKDA